LGMIEAQHISKRLPVSNPSLDKAELEWWEKYSEVEDRFCWVHTQYIQKLIRGDYIKRISKLASPDKCVAELGCGTGWLSILVAQAGARNVVGFDFSSTQIARAQQQALEAHVENRASFKILESLDSIRKEKLFDVVILHGFLHHLTTQEIVGVVEKIHELIKKDGILIIFEPVQYTDTALAPSSQRFLKVLEWLRRVPSRGMNNGLRKVSSEEKKFRELIVEREVGTPPYGPSPKEIPFLPDEIPSLIEPYFLIKSRKPYMVYSHLTAKELLLMELSYPFLANLICWPLLTVTRFFERRLLSQTPHPPLCIFEMFECVTR